ncbi:hypothetical protein Desaci_2513 [Desulfosporosinus acidiphilus SJ4]|uniref:Uncharacterized protein n=1 Tax=Desulfosporosinus acidiphilus (strain DSM 22704 / JCM 16185 / SJ4) TaxID=646529 RepID=I4D6N3_DESAJ|nr:hypothetical protein [Desulfosporosinus acidiphilus]AFM41457.1 hypothetical protein Desaci_2513 [Desulfosporosinus acidiphilus SJ4]
MTSEGNLISVSKKQLGLFYILLATVWFGESINEIIHYHFSAGLSLFVFGSLFLIALYLIQSYFTRMLLLYQKNLNSSRQALKNRR